MDDIFVAREREGVVASTFLPEIDPLKINPPDPWCVDVDGEPTAGILLESISRKTALAYAAAIPYFCARPHSRKLPG